MLIPRRVKHRKQHHPGRSGAAKGGTTIAFGDYGLQALEPAYVTNRQIESAPIAMTRYMKRGGKVWIRIFPDKPITKKPAETRMGKGKGNPEGWVAVVKPGRIMFEIEGVTEELAKKAMALAAVAFAKASRPSSLEAVTVSVDEEETQRLVEEWDEAGMTVPLKVIASPYREVTTPILRYVKSLRTENPRDIVTVYIPEYVVGRWWEQLLHNQTALRLKARLLFTPGVMMVSVPYQLRSSRSGEERALAHDDQVALDARFHHTKRG